MAWQARRVVRHALIVMMGTVVRQKRSPHKEEPVVNVTAQVPLEVYSLIVHAQQALREGDADRADSAMELALRRLER